MFPRQGQVGAEEETFTLRIVAVSPTVVVERTVLVVERFVGFNLQRCAALKEYFMRQTYAGFSLFFPFGGIIAVGRVQTERLPLCLWQSAKAFKSPSLLFGPLGHALQTIFRMIGCAVAVGIP